MASDSIGAPDPDTPEDLLAWARTYAGTVDIDVDLDAVSWEISKHARRRAGACRYDPDGGVTIVLSWHSYQAHGWGEVADTVRHELVHAWEFQRFGESGHGPRFKQQADAVDAPRHCEPFADPRYLLRCRNDGCEWSARRYRASKTVTEPARYRCGDCGDRYVVEHTDSGRTWEDGAGFEQVRAALEDDW
ncbi:SprT family zinc-dependent metalloprotease [Haloarchaeobius baliensis]|uniref:SprT family zinc-dependent metalloprotease n=1 Tax=Haloarchaeobius baliensis TaxID=1670458 RepID=UPI003F883F17